MLLWGRGFFSFVHQSDITPTWEKSSRLHSTEIGRYCSIAADVYLGLGIHPLSPFVSTHPSLYLRRELRGWCFADRDYREEFGSVKIGHDVWIGFRGVVRDGVTVGDGAVIAAGAIVVSDVPPLRHRRGCAGKAYSLPLSA